MNNSRLYQPLVSVIIPSYNQANFVKSAIESVLNQSYRQIEIIVVNDGSTDNTLDVIKKITTKEKISIVTTRNRGLAAARNTGLEQAAGNFVAFLDSDDLYLPHKLSLHIDFLLSHPDIDISYSETRYFNNKPEDAFSIGKRPQIEGDPFSKLIRGNFIPSNAFVVKTDMIRKIGGYDPSLRAHEDWDMLLRLSLSGAQFGYINAVTNLVRIHASNMTKQRRRMVESEIIVINKVWQMKLSKSQRKELDSALLPQGLHIIPELLLLNDRLTIASWISSILHHQPSTTNQLIFYLVKFILPLLQWPLTLSLIRKFKNETYHSSKQ